MARRVHASQKERLQRVRAEKLARAADDAQAKKAPKSAKAAKGSGAKAGSTRATAASKKGRKVMVWAVLNQSYKPVKTFPYKEKDEAEAHAAKLTREKKKDFFVKALKQDAE